jgi:hypothetical protein
VVIGGSSGTVVGDGSVDGSVVTDVSGAVVADGSASVVVAQAAAVNARTSPAATERW